MKPEIKEKLLTALRSGEYKKGTQVLRSKNDTFCCLGVLCDLHRKDMGIAKAWTDPTADTNAYTYGDYYGVGTIPINVREWAGCDKSFGGVGYFIDKKNEVCSLAQINDTNDTFEPVITAIEENF